MTDTSGQGLPSLLTAADAGDQHAWDTLVDRFSPMLWSICRGYRLGEADCADAVQNTWIRLMEHLGKIKDPERVAGWLATTCRRECQAVLRRSRRTQLVGDTNVFDRTAPVTPGPDEPVLLADRDAELWQAFSRLSARCQRILRAVVIGGEDGPLTYREAAQALDVPIGALGPTRGRCLRELRVLLFGSA